MNNKKTTVKAGNLIRITERKCSDKIQPQIKTGGVYHVLGLDKTKTGADVLLLELKTGGVTRCNETRFTWERVKTEQEIKEEQKQAEALAVMLKAAKEKAEYDAFNRMITDLTFEEQTQISFIPMVIYHIAWVFALKAVKNAADNRIEIVKKLSRTVKMLREKYIDDVSRDLNREHLKRVEDNADSFMKTHANDFALMFHSTLNVINHQHVGIMYDELRTYAYLTKRILVECRAYENRMTELIRQRLGSGNEAHLPFQKELYYCMDAYLGDYEIKETTEVYTAMKIFMNNISKIKYTLTKE